MANARCQKDYLQVVFNSGACTGQRLHAGPSTSCFGLPGPAQVVVVASAKLGVDLLPCPCCNTAGMAGALSSLLTRYIPSLSCLA